MSEETETQLVAEAEALADEAVEKAEEVKAFADDVLTSPTDEGTMKFAEIQAGETTDVTASETVDVPLTPDEEAVTEPEAVNESGTIPAMDEVADETTPEVPVEESGIEKDPEETVSSDVVEGAVELEEVSEETDVTEEATEVPEASEAVEETEEAPTPEAVEAVPAAVPSPGEPVDVEPSAPAEEGPDPVADDEASPVAEEAPEPIPTELAESAADEAVPLQDEADTKDASVEPVKNEVNPAEVEPSVEPSTVEESPDEAATIAALDSLEIQGSPTDEHLPVDPAVSDNGADPHPDIDSAPTDEGRLHEIYQSEIVTEEEALLAAQKKLEEEEEERLKQLELAEMLARKEAENLARLEAEQRALELATKELIPMDEAQADGVPLSPSGKVRTLDLADVEAKAQQQANVDCGCIIL